MYSDRMSKSHRSENRSYATQKALPTNPSRVFRRFPVRAESVIGSHKSDFNDCRYDGAIAQILGVPDVPCDRGGRSLVRMKSTDVPRGILGSGYSGLVFTPRAETCNDKGQVGRGQGSDDNAYKNHPDLQRVLPRCYSVLLIFDSTDRCVARHIIQGLYKFGGQARDEDSHIGSDGLYQQAPLSEATRIVLSEKANGKAFVLTMFQFRGKTYFFGGSKGQHHVIRATNINEDLSHLNSQFFAYQELRTFFDVWESMDKKARTAFQEEMVGTAQNDGCTACGEWADGKHMVPLKPRAKPACVMFGLVQNRGAITKSSSLCDDVVTVLDWYKAIGFETVHYEVVSPEELEERRDTLRSGRLNEGWVIYYQMKKNAEWSCIAVEKYKLWWYIIIRVIREFVKRGTNLIGYERKLTQRLNKRNNDFMFIPQPIFRKWEKLALTFVGWFLDKGYDSRVNQLLGFDQHSVGMAGVWSEFIRETGENDDFKLAGTGSKKRKIDTSRLSSSSSSSSSRQKSPVVVKRTASSSKSGGVQISFSGGPQPPKARDGLLTLGGRRTSVGKKGSIKIAFNTRSEDVDMGDAKKATSKGRKPVTCGVFVVFQGICGLGKTYLRSFLEAEFKKRGVTAIGLEQDSFVARHGKKKAGRACLREFESLIDAGKHDVIFLQRNNACLQQFAQYARAASEYGWMVHVVTPRYMQTSLHLPLVCMQSVFQRFAKKDHPSFKGLKLGKQFQITLSFLAMFAVPPVRGTVDYVDEIDYLSDSSLHNMIPSEVVQYFQDYLDHIKKRPFQAEEWDGKETAESLGLDKKEYQAWRLAPENIAKAICDKVSSSSLVRAQTSLTSPAPQTSFTITSNSFPKKKKFKNTFGTSSSSKASSSKSSASASSSNKSSSSRGDILSRVTFGGKKRSLEIREKREVPKSRGTGPPIFVYLGFDDDVKERLRGKLDVLGEDCDLRPLTDEKLHHVTLMHRNNKDEDPEAWENLLEREGEKFGIVVTGVAYSPRKLTAFSCDIRSKTGGPESGKNMRHLCYSGFPHITARLANRVKPVESKVFFERHALKRLQAGETYTTYDDTQLCFPATVSVFRGQSGGGWRRR